MPWFKIDDKFHSHRKATKAGIEAVGLWALCGSWAADQLTDGFVPDYVAARFSPDYERLADRLVAVGLWEPATSDGDDGWRFHDWGDENPTREQVLSRRRKDAEKKQRARSRVGRDGGTGRFVPKMSPGDTPGEYPGESLGVSPPWSPDYGDNDLDSPENVPTGVPSGVPAGVPWGHTWGQ